MEAARNRSGGRALGRAAGGVREMLEGLSADAPNLLVDLRRPHPHLPVHPARAAGRIDDADALAHGVQDLAGLLAEQGLLEGTKIAGVTEDAGEAALPELSNRLLDASR